MAYETFLRLGGAGVSPCDVRRLQSSGSGSKLLEGPGVGAREKSSICITVKPGLARSEPARPDDGPGVDI